MSIFLSKEDVIELTKFTQPKKQKEHLTREGIPYTVDRNGRPIILKESLIKKPETVINRPNWRIPA